MPDYKWPEASKRTLIGKRISRIDAPDKVTGRAKYTHDRKLPEMLYGKIVRCPYAHAKVVSIDTSAAEKMPGVKAVTVVQGPGKEIFWAGDEVVAIAATDEALATDAARAVKVVYEQLPHLVNEEDLAKAGDRAKDPEERTDGDPDKGFKEAEVVSEGQYGVPVITHCTLETHGSLTSWEAEDKLLAYISTQAVSDVGAGIRATVETARSQRPRCPGPRRRGIRQQVRGRPLGRRRRRSGKEGGQARPHGARARRGADGRRRPPVNLRQGEGGSKEGRHRCWHGKPSRGEPAASPGADASPVPYVWRIPNRLKHYSVETNIGPARAWRAPNHPQGCYITMCALEDLAAMLKMDPLDLFLKNIEMTAPRADLYKEELLKAAEMIDWKKKWHQRGDPSPGPPEEGAGAFHSHLGRTRPCKREPSDHLS